MRKLKISPSGVLRNMGETFIIDTSSATQESKRIDPLPLFDEHYLMLRVVMPEYKNALPNRSMDILVKRMFMTMKLYGGIGLSANQCGVKARVFVLGTDELKIACINPKIVEKSSTSEKMPEACLSYPGLILKVDRPKWVLVEYTTVPGKTVQVRLDGAAAQVFVHELDHLNGLCFVDNVGAVALSLARRKQVKVLAKHQKRMYNIIQRNNKL